MKELNRASLVRVTKQDIGDQLLKARVFLHFMSRAIADAGGHISSIDAAVDSGSDPYQEGMRRELEEEVIIDTPYTVRCVGMINDDLTEVGKVHLGVVHLFDVERPDVQSREDEIREAGFRPVAELMGQLDQFESWSEICLRALFATDPQ